MRSFGDQKESQLMQREKMTRTNFELRLCWRLLQLAAVSVLQVWRDCNGYHSPIGVLTFDSMLKQITDKVSSPVAPALVILGDSTVDVGDLYDLGARQIAVVSLPPLGCIPWEIYSNNGQKKCIEPMNNDCETFNTGLQNSITSLQGTLPGSKIVYLDAFTLSNDAFVNPSKFGILNNNTYQTCCEFLGVPETGPFCDPLLTACVNADDYLFWDAYHPTQFFTMLAADAFYSIMSPAMGL